MPTVGSNSQPATPKHLRSYLCHGVRLEWEDGADQAIGDCPFCGRERKFSVNIPTGVWRCFVCNEGTSNSGDIAGGNNYTFIRKLYEMSDANEGKLRALAEERRLLSWDSLKAWGVKFSMMDGGVIFPGFGADGKINNLYFYKKFWDNEKKKWGMRVEPTHEMSHQMFGMQHWDPQKPFLYVAEGFWDGVAFWEVAQMARYEGDKLVSTGAPEASLYADANVLAVPGCNSPLEPLVKMVGERNVALLFDNDHPKGPNKNRAAFEGMKRFSQGFARATEKPAQVHHLRWGPDGYDPALPHGYDVRDAIAGDNQPIEERVEALGGLLDRIQPIPDDWVAGRSKTKSAHGGLEIESLPCTSYKALQMSCRKAMKWTEGLDHGMTCMLATIVSTPMQGDQLWMKITGPASCGKSTLCEAVSVARKYVYPKDSLAGGLVSGYQTDKDGSENLSMVEKLHNKTLVINDGDTLLQLPNLLKVLSQLRAFYGRNIRTQFGNMMSADHEGINCTILLCGTSSLRKLDSSELGERFLECCIMKGIDEELENNVLWRVVNAADRALNFEFDGSVESQNDPDKLQMMQLTGGYIEYLRSNARELFAAVNTSEEAMRSIVNMGMLIAYLRARPSKEQDEIAEREFGARLVSQLMRLAKCLAVVLNKKSIDADVLGRVSKVVLDTAHGLSLDIAQYLYPTGNEGMESSILSGKIGHTIDKTRVYLTFLKKIGAADVFTPVVDRIKQNPRWRLSKRLQVLYREVLGGRDNEGNVRVQSVQ